MDNAVQDPTSQVSAIEQCLSGAKRPIGPFLGAGCPTAIHLEDQSPLIPHVNGETRLVEQRVVALANLKTPFDAVQEHRSADGYQETTVEDMGTLSLSPTSVYRYSACGRRRGIDPEVTS